MEDEEREVRGRRYERRRIVTVVIWTATTEGASDTGAAAGLERPPGHGYLVVGEAMDLKMFRFLCKDLKCLCDQGLYVVFGKILCSVRKQRI
jgi:hypothetical protein